MAVPTHILSQLSALLGAGSEATVERFREGVLPRILESVRSFGPESTIVASALVILIADFFLPRRASKHLAWAALAACIPPLVWVIADAGEQGTRFLGMTAVDPFASFFRAFLLVAAIAVILLSFSARSLDGRRMGEYYFLVLTSVFGGMLMASATHFLSIFLAMEILSISSYVLVCYFRTERRGAEAALKYIVYGSVAAGIMAYGFSLWFGLTGSGQIAALANVLRLEHDAKVAAGTVITALLAFLCIFVGLAYKTSSVPMHFWTPDVYEGAPTPVTAFLSVLSKSAGFALALRFLGSLASSIASFDVGSDVRTVWDLVEWPAVLVVVAALTMTIGNLAALWQTNLKRLMAYSSIAHAGYITMGLTLLRPDVGGQGMATVSFYLLAYLTMNLGAFAVIILVENRTGSVELDDYRGLGRRSVFLSVALTVFLFSLIGVPPTAGFMGKFQLFLGVVGLGSRLEAAASPDWWQYYALVLVAVVNTAVSAYYYLKIVKTMFFEDRAASAPETALPSRYRDSLVGSLLIIVLLVLTFWLCFRADGLLRTTLNLQMHV